MIDSHFPLAPFWALSSLVNEVSAPQGELVSLERIEGKTGRLLQGEGESNANGRQFRKDDVLFGKLRPYLAKYWLADRPGTAQGDIHVYRPTLRTDPRFLAYIVGSDYFTGLADTSSTGSKMPRVEWPKVAQFRVPFPPRRTQRAIADYLDRETAEIDAMTADLDKVEALLTERRVAYIGRAVRTISGPSKRVCLQSIARIHAGETITAADIEDDGLFAVYGGNGVRGYADRANEEHDRVLVGRQGALCGNVHLARGPFFASEHALVVEPHIDVDLEWLALVLSDQNLGQLSMSAAQPGITAMGVGLQKIDMPGMDEQRRIAAQIDRETAEIDAMLADIMELRGLLAERRAAVIAAAVNGQIDIPTAEEPTHA